MARPRKPRELKLLQGTLRESRENQHVPVLPVRSVTYDPPTWLGAKAREEWVRLEEPLRRSGVLTEADLAAYAHYCSRFEAAMKAEEYQLAAKTKKAWAYWDGIARKAWSEMSKAAQQLGMTPASRSKVPATLNRTPRTEPPASTGLTTEQRIFGRTS